MVRRLRAPLIALLLNAPSISRADEPREAARAHYAHGVELAGQGAYETALQEFTAAYDVNPHFAVLYNIAQCHIALGHPREAIEALSKYLAEGKDQIPTARRDQVQSQVALMEARIAATNGRSSAAPSNDGREIGEVTLASPPRVEPSPPAAAVKPPETASVRVQCPQSGAEVRIDDATVDLAAAARGIPVTPGTHRVAFSSGGRAATEQSLEMVAGTTALVFCGDLPAPPADSPPYRTGTATVVGYVLGGAGIAAGGAAIAHYLWNKGRYDDWRAARGQLAPGTSGYYDRQLANNDLADSIDRASNVTVGLTITSGALLAAGAALWLADRGNTKAETNVTALAAPARGFRIEWGGPSAGGTVTWSGVW